MTDDTLVSVVNGDESVQVSIADIAGLDMSGIEEFRGMGGLPAGTYEFRIKNFELGDKEIKDKDAADGKAVVPVAQLQVEVLACRHTKDQSVDPSTLTGAEHGEMFFIRDLGKDLGRIKAFLNDIGAQGQGSLGEILAQQIGMEFAAVIKKRKDRNDTSKEYSNIDFNTVQPIGGAQADNQQSAPQPAAAGNAGGGSLKLGGQQ